MAYTKTNWQNDQAPAINAANLNKIEQGIFNNDALLSSIMNTLGIDTQTWVSTDSYVEGQVVVYNNYLYKNITGDYTTTPPDEDTTNWLLISIINSNGKLDKSLIPYFNNTYNNSTDEGYSCVFINKALKDVYSTNETKTNKVWNDGKPIYRKVLIVSHLPDTGSYQWSIGVANLDLVKINYGESYMTWVTPRTYPIIRVNPQIEFVIDNNKSLEVITVDNSYVNWTAYVVLEYTKTTD